MIYSPLCDDPSSMIILDVVTGKVYSEDEARHAPREIRQRLVNHCTRQGYWVKTMDELR